MFRFWLYRLGEKVALLFPRRVVYRIADLVSVVYRLWARKDRVAVEENIRVILGHNTPKRVVGRYAREVSVNFAYYLVDFFRFKALDSNYVRSHIHIEGLDVIDRCLARGKGLIVVSGHIANWELAGAAMALSGYPVVCVVLRHRRRNIDDFFRRQREAKGLEVAPLGRAAFGCLRALRQNKMVALLGDRDFTGAGIACDFFGRQTIIPRGPALLAIKTGAPLVVGIMLRQGRDRFRLVYEGPIDAPATGEEEEKLQRITREYLDILERYIKDYPGQWLMFRRFWEKVGMDCCE